MNSEDRKQVEEAQELTPEQLEDVTGGGDNWNWLEHPPQGPYSREDAECPICEYTALRIDPAFNHGMKYWCIHCNCYYKFDENGDLEAKKAPKGDEGSYLR